MPDRHTDAGAVPVPDAGDDITVHTVQLDLCELCIRGEGGECHTPGCSMWINRAPDLPLDTHPSFRIVPDAGDDTLRRALATAIGNHTVPIKATLPNGEQAWPASIHILIGESEVAELADALLPLIREHTERAVEQARADERERYADWHPHSAVGVLKLIKAEVDLDKAHQRGRKLESEWQARWRKECDRADKAERERDENLQNVRKVDDLRMAEIKQLNDAIKRVRGIHDGQTCPDREGRDESGGWTCPTLRALDGTEGADVQH